MDTVHTKYYCNCCGEDFTSDNKDVVCPNCGCEYDEDNDNIEKYNEHTVTA